MGFHGKERVRQVRGRESSVSVLDLHLCPGFCLRVTRAGRRGSDGHWTPASSMEQPALEGHLPRASRAPGQRIRRQQIAS